MSDNILEPLVNELFELGKIIKKLFKGDTFNFIEYFKTVKLCNKLEVYPKLLNEYEGSKGTIYLFSIPMGLGLEDFKKCQGGLVAAIGKNVDIRLKNKCVEIEIITKVLPSKIDYKVPKKLKDTILLPIGESLEGTVSIDLKENSHSYIVGQTGSGKSVCTKVILTSLINTYSPNEVELYLADLKRVELNLFANVSHCKRFVYTVSDTTELIADLLEETNRRYDLFMQHKVTSIFEYNKLKGVNKLKYQVLYIEEMVLLLEDSKKKAQKLLKQLMAISRASGLYVICTTQRPSSDIIDNVIKSLISNRIVFKVEDTKNSIICLDQEGAELLEGMGHGILKVGANKTEFRGYYITDNQVKEYTKKYIVNRPCEPIRATEKVQKTNSDTLVMNQKVTCLKANTEVEKITDLSFIDKL